MDAPMAKGTLVRQVVPAIEGEVADVAFDADALSFKYLVNYTDSAGENHSRWFMGSEIAAKKETA